MLALIQGACVPVPTRPIRNGRALTLDGKLVQESQLAL